MAAPRALQALQAALLCLALCAAPCLASSAPSARPRGRLLRVPKVYNALITSNEPLLPSRTEQATVGQVLYYPPHPHHASYPASAGPLILPQVAAQPPPLYDPSRPAPPGSPPQPLESVPQQGGPDNPPLELALQGPGQQGLQQQGLQQQDGVAPGGEQQQVTPWPVVYASDVQQQQYADGQAERAEPQYGQPQEGDLGPGGAPRPAAAPFPAARAVQTVERLEQPGQYQPPPAVDIDSVKNNRPQGIPDVPPPPLPVGRGRKAQHQQPPPPGLLLG